jgi:hypothetical protein
MKRSSTVLRVLTLMASGVGASSLANAGEYCWNETVQYVILNGGDIYFTTNKSCPSWCKVDPAWTEEQRKRAYAMLLSAKLAEKPLTLYWTEHATSCAGAVPAYSIPIVVLLM